MGGSTDHTGYTQSASLPPPDQSFHSSYTHPVGKKTYSQCTSHQQPLVLLNVSFFDKSYLNIMEWLQIFFSKKTFSGFSSGYRKINTWSNTNLSWALDSIMVCGWSSPSSSSSVGNWLFFRGSPGCAGDICGNNHKIRTRSYIHLYMHVRNCRKDTVQSLL